MAELDNWGLDTVSDQITVELLANSRQATQVIPTTTYPSRVKYGQSSQITIISLFAGVIINCTLRTLI